MMITLFRYFVLRNLTANPVRTLLTLLGVALGIALNTSVSTINQSTSRSFRESVEALAGKAALTVTAGEAGFSEAIEDTLRSLPEIQSTAPMIETHAHFKNKMKETEAITVFGIDLLKEQSVRIYQTGSEQVIEDPLEFLNQSDSIILTLEFARRKSLRVGDKIVLVTAHGDKNFTVRGLLEPSGPAKAYGGMIAIMDIDGARVSFGKVGKVDRVDLVLRPGSDPRAVASKVEALLGPAYHALPPNSQLEQLNRMVASFEGMLQFLGGLALIIGLFLVANSVSVSVAEKRNEMGTLRALGAESRSILSLILLESAVIGVIAGALGAMIGRVMAHLMIDEVIRAMGNQTGVHFEIRLGAFGIHDAVQAMVLGSVVCIGASVWPAIRALRVSPVEALKPKGLDLQTVGLNPPSLWIRSLPWIGGVFLLVLALLKAINPVSTANPAVNGLQSLMGVLGSAFLAPKLVEGLLFVFHAFLRESRFVLLRAALDNLLRNPSRTASNILSLIIGLMLVVIIAAVNLSFKETLKRWTDKVASVGQMTLSSNGRVVQFQVQPLHESILQEVGKIPGVSHLPNQSPVVLRFIRAEYEGIAFAIKAVDRPQADSDYKYIDSIDLPSEEAGKRLFSHSGPGILISENFSTKFKKRTGDTLSLNTVQGSVSFQILGIIRDFAHPNGVIYMPRSLYKDLWQDPLITAIFVSAAPGTSLENLRSQINSSVGRTHGIVPILNSEMVDQLIEVVDESFSFNKAIEMAALLLGLIGLFNTLLVSVMERTREFGMLRAVGMSRRQLMRLVLAESVLQGIMGATVAAFLGIYISWLWVTVNLSSALGWEIQYFFPAQAALRVLLAGTAVALFAAILPALRASSLQIRTALEYE